MSKLLHQFNIFLDAHVETGRQIYLEQAKEIFRSYSSYGGTKSLTQLKDEYCQSRKINSNKIIFNQ